VDGSGSIRVLPAFTSRRFLPEKLSRLRQIDGAVLVHQRGQGSEFDSLREYVLGDDVRAIDWRATARAGDVVVRTWRPERDRHVVLVIDTGRTSAARIGDTPRLDAALDASLLLAAVAARAGDRVALVAGDVTIRARLAPTGGSGVLPALVAALTPLEPTLIETDPQALISEVRRRTSQRALVIVFGALDAGSADSTLLPVAAALAARHQVVVASVADPRLNELAHARDSVSDLYTAGAAELALAHRRSVAAELARLGVRVVDVAVDLFASRVTDAYLDERSRHRREIAPNRGADISGRTGPHAAATEHDHVGQKHRLGQRANADPSRGRQPGWGDERFDNPGYEQDADEAHRDHRAGPTGLSQ
jgi:uncharacterized protein (DUF58 family)